MDVEEVESCKKLDEQKKKFLSPLSLSCLSPSCPLLSPSVRRAWLGEG